jgi:hypothetical protein
MTLSVEEAAKLLGISRRLPMSSRGALACRRCGSGVRSFPKKAFGSSSRGNNLVDRVTARTVRLTYRTAGSVSARLRSLNIMGGLRRHVLSAADAATIRFAPAQDRRVPGTQAADGACLRSTRSSADASGLAATVDRAQTRRGSRVTGRVRGIVRGVIHRRQPGQYRSTNCRGFGRC